MRGLLRSLTLEGQTVLSIPALLGNLFIGAVLAWLLRWHFRRFGSTQTNREEFAHVFPFILLTTVLIITVVKSSLALSLGLVGALSIVRFRTPVKEPEELAYLFLAIAVGLGLGAGQRTATILAAAAILAVMAGLKSRRARRRDQSLHLSVDWKPEPAAAADRRLATLNDVIVRHAEACDLRRFDVREESVEATYVVRVADAARLSALADDLRASFPGIGVTFLDQSAIWNV